MTTAAAEGQLPRGRTDALARRFGLDTVELGALVVLAGLSVAVLAALLTKGRAITGADGSRHQHSAKRAHSGGADRTALEG